MYHGVLDQHPITRSTRSDRSDPRTFAGVRVTAAVRARVALLHCLQRGAAVLTACIGTTQGHTSLLDVRIPAVMETCTCHRVVVVSGRHLPAAARLPRPRAPALFRRACGRFVGVACVVDAVGAAGCAAVQHDRLHVRFPVKTVHRTQLKQVSTTLGRRVRTYRCNAETVIV
jgi:hypothetical protein